MIGLAQAGAIGEIDINRLVRRKVQVIGSYGGRARQDLPKLVKLAESGIFNLADAVTRKYGFEEAGKAFQDLNQGKIAFIMASRNCDPAPGKLVKGVGSIASP
ncbi:alcohol dehydrogenase class [Salix suchowensis]|nr:alcohol dehydrogenase class [Salix suchowensis]